MPLPARTIDTLIDEIETGETRIADLHDAVLADLVAVLGARLADATSGSDAHVRLAAAIINAHVRAGDLDAARAWLASFDLMADPLIAEIRTSAKGRPRAA